MKDIRKDFPVLSKHPSLVYLDSACTSLKPKQVIEALTSYYTEIGACGGRSSHRLGRVTTEASEQAREKVASFIKAKPKEIIWNKNTTEGLNLVAASFDFSRRRKVVTTIMEHHAVLLPYMKLRDEGKIDLRIIPCAEAGVISMDAWNDAIDRDTALVVTNSGSNTTGVRQDVKTIGKIAHDSGAMICVDGAQGVPHHQTDFKGEGADFLAFSAHKMAGPTGIGALAMREDIIPKMRQFISGGGTVRTVSTEGADIMPDHTRFEAGVQHYSGIIGFGAACEYLRSLGMDEVEAHEKMMAREILDTLESAGAVIYATRDLERKGPLFSFNLKGGKAHDVALLLDKSDIATRSGFFCAQPAMEMMGAKDGAVRASAYIYNTKDDIRKLGDALRKISVLYG